jgi:23S rRNA (adenine2503-C2)-methyltransferase
MTPEELRAYFIGTGEKAFRASQVFRWMHQGAGGFDEMTNLPAALRDKLGETAEIRCLNTVRVLRSALDGTVKFVFETRDGRRVESVFMRYRYGNSVCVSSQAGCRMGCRFCSSAREGLERNLSAGEITDQILLAEKDTGERAGRVVIMGTGEPFDNFENMKRFVETITRKESRGLSRRNITVSTCGLIPEMRRFAEELPQVNLAVSLHAANDETRNMLMPVNRKYGMNELLNASREYTVKTGRRITFEYALISGVNDGRACAAELAGRLRGMNCHVNVISMNPVAESGLTGGGREAAAAFAAELGGAGVQATVRRELGRDIAAACGQLRLGITAD